MEYYMKRIYIFGRRNLLMVHLKPVLMFWWHRIYFNNADNTLLMYYQLFSLSANNLWVILNVCANASISSFPCIT